MLNKLECLAFAGHSTSSLNFYYKRAVKSVFLLVSSSFGDVGVDMEAFLLLPRLVVNSVLRASGVAGLSLLGSKGLWFPTGPAGERRVPRKPGLIRRSMSLIWRLKVGG